MHAFADQQLAERLEAIVAVSLRSFAETTRRLWPETDAECLEVAGGVAAYVVPGSPLNSAGGLGFAGEVGHDDIERLEHFYEERGERPVINLCPLAHASLPRVLGERGWTIVSFENVLVRDLPRDEELPQPDPHVGIELAETPEERERWALMVANGFAAPDDPTPAELRLGRAAAAREEARLLTAMLDGQPSGTGELEIWDDIAWLSADTTLPQFRGRGVQRSLQRARLALGRDAGCTLAVTESVPGSGSQRNMERLGFRVVYTRCDVTAPKRG